MHRRQASPQKEEPGFLWTAAERGRIVLVRAGTTLEVGDQQFIKISIVPSIVLVADIPDNIQESWYRGQVLVGFKDAAFEPCFFMRHATELAYI